KTSLLLAGVFPALRQSRMLPVAVRRFEYGAGAPGLSAQLHRALTAAVADEEFSWSGPAASDAASDPIAGLWEHLHLRDPQIVDAKGGRWTPVFVLDQFEEIFTLETDQGRRQQAFRELGDLLENRVPPAVEQRLDTDAALLDRVDLDHQSYRCLLSIREDF